MTADKFEQFEPAEWRETFRPYVLHDDGTVNPYYPTDFLLDKGFDVILGSACRCSGDSYWFPDSERHYPNILDTARHARTSKVLGQCLTDWAVRQASPGTRMLGIAMGLWGLTDKLDAEAAASRFASEFCGLPESAGAKLLRMSSLLSKQPPFSRARLDPTERSAFQPYNFVQDMEDINVSEERKRLPELRKEFEESSNILSDVLSEATQPGASWLAQWLLAADALVLRTNMAEAALDHKEGRLTPDRARELLRNTDTIEKRTRELFKPIYSAESFETHMIIRFAGDRKFLEKTQN
jgi:hypothetical protein